MKKKSTKRRQWTSTTRTLASQPSLPTLPFDLLPEILCRLPVKLLLQLRCVCKSWKSLISDPKFTKKHLSMSKASQDPHHLLVQTVGILLKLFLKDSLISSFFTAAVSTSRVSLTQLRFPTILHSVNSCYSAIDLRVCSCDGILCFTNVTGTIAGHSAILWNPSIRRFNIFPPLENLRQRDHRSLYSFGYDHYTHTYKIVAVSFFYDNTNQVSVCTLGTASWRSIQPIRDHGYINSPGVFLSGTINWLAYDALSSFPYTIVSLDLEKESYQKLLQPNVKTKHWTLGVLRDCLCIVTSTDMFVDVWIMKEYGNKGPWTKFFSVPYMRDQGLAPYDNVLYITEDDLVLMYFHDLKQCKFGVYDSKSCTFNMPELQKISRWMDPKVYVESLISPCS